MKSAKLSLLIMGMLLGKVVHANPEPKFTHYAYRGDVTPDRNSAHGIGDRDNKLIDRYSVALTQAERLARFGVKGHSTGKEFRFNGKTYRDDDTAPGSGRCIDLYDPTSM